MYVVKIGGSLITEKNEYCSPKRDEIREFAKVVKRYWDKLQGKLVLVLGGGSYGNGVPIRYNIKNSRQDWKRTDLLMMTVKMFEWINEVTMIFRAEGIACYPFQTSGYCTTRQGVPRSFCLEPIKMCLDLGILPVTSGDLTFDESETFVIFSSDNVPELFVDYFDVERVVIITDVPGIYESMETKNVIRKVTQENYNDILRVAGTSNKQDVTGGMNNKLKALIRIAQKNTTSVLCDGTNPNNLIKALFDEEPPGTIVEAWNKGEPLC